MTAHPSSIPLQSRTLPSLFRAIAAVLILAVLGSSIASAAPPNAQRTRQLILNRGLGKGIKIKLIGGIEITGAITDIRDDDFDVTPRGLVQPTAVPYAQVANLHPYGNSPGRPFGWDPLTNTIVAIVVLLVAMVVITVVELAK